jgi:hypothetical protein
MMFNAFAQLGIAASAARRHRSFIKASEYKLKTTRLMTSGLSEDEKHERFLQMEHENWEEGFEAVSLDNSKYFGC